MIKIDLNNGKYEIIFDENPTHYVFEALRYGERWRNLIGDNLILFMLYKIIELQEELDRLKGGK